MQILFKPKYSIFVVIFFVILILIGWQWHKADTHQPHYHTPVVKVKTKTLKNQLFPLSVESQGVIYAPQMAVLAAQQSGDVSQINYHPGQTVTKGETLIALNSRYQKAAVADAQAAYNNAENLFERYKKLGLNLVGAQSYLNYRNAAEDAAAKLKEAQVTLSQMQIKAPFTGIVSAAEVAVGDYVEVGNPLLTLVNHALLQVNFNVPQQDLLKLKLGQAGTVALNSNLSKTYAGKLVYIAPNFDVATHLIAVRLQITNPPLLLKPGMLVHVRVVTDANNSGVVIPAISLISTASGQEVYIVNKKSKAVAVPVTVAAQRGKNIFITQGLKPGMQLVVAGQNSIHDGSQVEVVNNVVDKASQ